MRRETGFCATGSLVGGAELLIGAAGATLDVAVGFGIDVTSTCRAGVVDGLVPSIGAAVV